MKRILALLTTFALVMLGGVVLAASAEAHTPNISVSCSGVTVSGSNYESGDTNTLSVSVAGGGSDSKNFATSGSATASVPQDGAVHTYTASVHTTNSNPAYSQDYSGNVGPCGTPPKPEDAVEHRDITDAPNCDTHTVTTEHQSRTIPYVLVDNVWVAGTPSEWTTDSTSSRITTHEECSIGTQPPNDNETRDVVDSPDCQTFTVTTEHQSRTREYVFDDASWSWVPGPWSDWHTDSSDTRDASLTECPPPVQPPPTASAVETLKYVCGDDFITVTTTTETTSYVLDVPTRTWHLGTPVTTTADKRVPTEKVDCSVGITITHKVGAVLPNTGGADLAYGLIGVGLIGAGAFIVTASRRRYPQN